MWRAVAKKSVLVGLLIKSVQRPAGGGICDGIQIRLDPKTK